MLIKRNTRTIDYSGAWHVHKNKFAITNGVFVRAPNLMPSGQKHIMVRRASRPVRFLGNGASGHHAPCAFWAKTDYVPRHQTFSKMHSGIHDKGENTACILKTKS